MVSPALHAVNCTATARGEKTQQMGVHHTLALFRGAYFRPFIQEGTNYKHRYPKAGVEYEGLGQGLSTLS